MYITRQLEEVREGLKKAALAVHRVPESVQLLAVSKTFPCEDIMQAYDAGQRHFGENRLQEILHKQPLMPADCRWHLIGPLQRNKVRKALSCGLELIEAVDSLRLAEAISRIAGELELHASILLEINVDAEESKHGFTPDELRSCWDALLELPHLNIQGLMCIPAFVDDAEKTRPAFRALADLAKELRARSGIALAELSMGMSHDFPIAIEEGASIVRVGTAIFGRRDYA